MYPGEIYQAPAPYALGPAETSGLPTDMLASSLDGGWLFRGPAPEALDSDPVGPKYRRLLADEETLKGRGLIKPWGFINS